MDVLIRYAHPDVLARLRNYQVDLKPGGMIGYADVDLVTGWQRIGAVLRLDPDNRQFTLVGMDVDGELYAPPEEGWLSTMLHSLAYEGNLMLQEVAFVHGERQLFVEQIFIGEEYLQVRLR